MRMKRWREGCTEKEGEGWRDGEKMRGGERDGERRGGRCQERGERKRMGVERGTGMGTEELDAWHRLGTELAARLGRLDWKGWRGGKGQGFGPQGVRALCQGWTCRDSLINLIRRGVSLGVKT